MTVGVLLITHGQIGKTLIQASTLTYGELPLKTACIGMDYRTDPMTLLPQLETALKKLDSGKGVLILTDVYGATPCNISQKLQKTAHIEIVTGLNLPMLLRVMNYPKLNLEQLTQKAVSGGKEGVLNCRSLSESNHA